MGFALLSPADAQVELYRAQIMRNLQEMAERDLEEDLALAAELLRRARAHDTLEAVLRFMSPPVQRKRGRQLGSSSKALAARRYALWSAYEDEKSKSPNATDAEIAQRLFGSGGQTYGASATAIAAHIAKLKAILGGGSLISSAGRPRKRGRPKKTAIPI
jgi:hypothetical protein